MSETHETNKESAKTTTDTADGRRFWVTPATQWDVFKYFLTLVIAISLWASHVEVNQAKDDARFDAIYATLKVQNDTLMAINQTLKEYAATREERVQRLTRVEAKLDVLIGDRSNGSQREREKDENQ